MSDDRWRDTYDAWKLASPYDNDEIEVQTDLGECLTCKGSGIILVNRHGGYLGAGPWDEHMGDGIWERNCPACGGVGHIGEDDEDQYPGEDIDGPT
jgi:DnaJ-class molecular chaperone